MTISLSTSAAQSLRHDGFCRFAAGDIAPASVARDGIGRLQAAVEHLPIDSHAPSANRYRRYSNAIVLPWSRRLEWLPNRTGPEGPFAEYYQEAQFNSEFPALVRQFHPLEEDLKQDPFLHAILWHDFDLTAWAWSDVQLARPFAVGVHLVKMLAAEAGSRSTSSPNHLHQDGEPFTFVHLMLRDNVVGARTVVAHPGCVPKMPEDVDRSQIYADFELREPLESYGVHDVAVSHYVSGIERGPEDRPGIRSALLTDFTPLVPAAS
jgi:hypothetical protein